MLSRIAVCVLVLFAGSVISTEEPTVCEAEIDALDVTETLRQLNNGEFSREEIERRTPEPELCSEGPANVEHILPDTMFKPPIYKFSCENLTCDSNSICSNSSFEWIERCANVYKKVNGIWVFQGKQLQVYESHTKCKCKSCRDFYHADECRAITTCPENPDSFCYWTPDYTNLGGGLGEPESVIPDPNTIDPHEGWCSCCEPKECLPNFTFNKLTCSCVCEIKKCPPGQYFDKENCRCECPKGTYLAPNGIDCIGDCKFMDLATCPHIKCADNPDLNCYEAAKGVCACPSCDAVPANSLSCTRTKCIDMKTKPFCKLDPCNGKCRCPNCDEQPDYNYCSNTYCGPNYSQQCNWDKLYNKCSCGHYY